MQFAMFAWHADRSQRKRQCGYPSARHGRIFTGSWNRLVRFRPKLASSSYEPQSGFTIESVAHEIRSRIQTGPGRSDSVCFEGMDSCTIYIPIFFGFYVCSTLKMRSFAGLCNVTTRQSTETGRDQSKCTGGGTTASRRAGGAPELYHRARPDADACGHWTQQGR